MDDLSATQKSRKSMQSSGKSEYEDEYIVPMNVVDMTHGVGNIYFEVSIYHVLSPFRISLTLCRPHDFFSSDTTLPYLFIHYHHHCHHPALLYTYILLLNY